MTDGASTSVVGRNFLALGAGEIVARIVAFSATIYLARTLGASSYGVIGVAVAVMLYLSRIVDAGMELGTGTREVAAHPDRVGAIAATMLLVRFVIAVVVLAGLAIVGRAVL